MKSSRTNLLGILLGVAITLAVAALQILGAFSAAELRAYDMRFNIRGQRTPPKDILLVTIDEETRRILNKSLSQINRHDYAKLINILKKDGARLIVFDIDFSTSRESDDSLAQAVSCAGNVIMSSFIGMGEWVHPNAKFMEQNIPCPVPDAALDVPGKTTIGKGGAVTIEWKKNPERKVDAYRVFYSLQPFDDPSKIPADAGGSLDVPGDNRSLTLTIEGAPEGTEIYTKVMGLTLGALLGEGAVNIIEDPDDRVRRIPLVVGRSADDTKKKAALSLETAVRATFSGEPELVTSTPSKLRFEEDGKSLEIPLLEGRVLINYIGGRDTFARASFGDVLHGKVAPESVKDKIVLVGNTHHLAHDEYPTPFGRQNIGTRDTAETGMKAGFTSGLEIHANCVNTILRGDYILTLGQAAAGMLGRFKGGKLSEKTYQTVALGTHIAMTLLIGFLATFLLIRLRVKIQITTAIFFVMLVIIAGSALMIFMRHNIWAPVVAPLVALTGTFVGGLGFHIWTEGREKRWIKETFGKYLAPSVVEQITRDPSRLKLGGDELELTAFFSDIQGFTSISEKLASPQRLVELLNEYLTSMANTIEQFEGTVDKYEGDAVIAFWGAPVHFSDHALKACLAALEQQKKFIELIEVWRKSGKWPEQVLKARVRMGINTGPMVVGNMGSKGRMNYTIMGDAVNLASRLEGVNKQYGSLIMISEDTYAQVKDNVEVRELDTIRVVGKAKPVTIYELIAQKGELSDAKSKIRDAFAEGLQNYRLRRWDRAIENFQTALQIDPDDGPASKYLDRCRAFIKEPPPDNWDGVFEMKTK